VYKWRSRDEFSDRSHRPNTLHTTLSTLEEELVIELRRSLFLTLDDLLAITQQFINKKVSRSGLSRCLKRHNVNKISDLYQKDPQTDQPVKRFKEYSPGFFHIDIKYLPKMADEEQRSYLYVAIERATRWVFVAVYKTQTADNAVDFVEKLKEATPIPIRQILTDNGVQFTDRFTSKTKQPSGRHIFDLQCEKLNIDHRLSPPRHPQTNGMVERFNGRIGEIERSTHFTSRQELIQTLTEYVLLYNQCIPQKALQHRTPIQTLQNWQKTNPDIFANHANNHAEPDT
jgi:transposase InsO family protein